MKIINSFSLAVLAGIAAVVGVRPMRLGQRHCTFAFFVALATTLVAAPTNSSATSLNIDFNQPIGGPGVPLSTFGGAAAQAGVWNGILGKDGVYSSIVDLSGNVLTGVSVDLGGSMSITPVANAPASLGANAALLGDYFFAPSFVPNWTLQIKGITDGFYDVYVYAPADLSVSTSAWFFSNSTTPQKHLNGSVDGTLDLGIDFLVARTLVTGNALIMSSGVAPAGFGIGLAGLQLTFVSVIPLPAALPLFLTGLAGLALFSRRQRQALRH